MPKAATYTLVWSPERNAYELYEQGLDEHLLVAGGPAWFVWLDTHRSFSFHGRAGQVSLLKEARKGGAGYWYAYRRQGRRTAKHYLGRDADLSMERLETAAGALNGRDAPIGHAPQSPEPFVPQPSRTASTQPLLAPKLQLPRLQQGLVARERLFAQLDTGLERKLTLVAAPAGFGKTTLVRQWLAQRLEARDWRLGESSQASSLQPLAPRAAWLSLDQGDNDPIRFWRYLIAACQSFQSDIGAASLALLAGALQPPFDPPSQQMMLTPFLNQLTQLEHSSTLILEDYHAIADPQIHEAVAFFIDHLPATLRLIILSRSAPPLPLARLRAGNDLCLLQVEELRFSADETHTFFQQSIPAQLQPEALVQLDAQMAGWPAGLRLFGLAIQGRTSAHEIAEALATFAGSHRPVIDYFVSEVLDAQPAQLQDFLLRTSPLDRLTGPLCDAALDNRSKTNDERRATDDGSAFGIRPASLVLEELARANLFIEPLDGTGQWYRYHTLFAEAMRYEARRRLGAGALRAISARASAWYEQQGALADAVEAALQAQDAERAALLIERILTSAQSTFSIQLFSEAAEAHTLVRWLEQLPEPVLRGSPTLCLSYAIALMLALMTGRTPRPNPALLEWMLNAAEEGYRISGNTAKLGEICAFRSMIAKQAGAIEQSIAWARQALALLPAEELAWRGASLSAIGTGEQFAGRLSIARRLLIEARAISEAIENWMFTRAIVGMLSSVYYEQGLLHQTAANLRQTLAEARAQADRDDICHALLHLVQISYEWNKLDQAEQEAREAYATGAQLSEEEFQVQALLCLAQIEHARGRRDSAQQQIAGLADRLLPRRAVRMRWHLRAARATQASFALAAGDLAAAQRYADELVAEQLTLPFAQPLREQLLMARLLIAKGQASQALDLLAHTLEKAEQTEHYYAAMAARVQIALAHAALRQLADAHQQLDTVLARAAGQELVRLFLDEGPSLEALLRSRARMGGEQSLIGYIQTLLRAFKAERATQPDAGPHTAPAGAGAEQLSPQEQRVLSLLAAGRSNPEIADQLVISVNTVKAHLKQIYRKLNVGNRMQASAAARLLEE
jgi:LuxR family maltose regulon positive regulatory protein